MSGNASGAAGIERPLKSWNDLAGRLVGESGWRSWEIAGAILALGVLAESNFRLDLLWTPATLPLVIASLAASILMFRRIPIGITMLWLLGLLTFLWSLTPGDTLLASLWGLLVVASAAAGRWRGALLLAMVVLVLNGLQDALALNAFGLQTYLSGSVHYRMGAKALVLVPIAVAGFARSQQRWLVLPWWALATVATYGALISGSRGVYVPLILIVVLLAWRLFGDRQARMRFVVGIVAMVVGLVAVDFLVPFHPAAEALGAKATVKAQAAAVATAGGFSDRLRFWEQGIAMARAHPFGVGLGGYRGTIHSYQRFPMLWSSSPHNVFVETADTVGWLGLSLLVALLGVAFWRAWTSPRWPWALALAGIWFTLNVDVTADYPSILTIAFALVGACLGPSSIRKHWMPGGRHLASWSAGLLVIAGTALASWWFAPCKGADCALTRWRGAETVVLRTIPSVPERDRPAYLSRLEQLYPKSLWVLQLEEKYAPSEAARLSTAREIATRYPLQSWRNYLLWANLSLAAGNLSQAKEAVRRGLQVFGPTAARFPEMRSDPKGFEAWLARARTILALSP